ncbi:hypothetical protein A9P44_01220 [Paenibacillus polymyxa]|nr:PTS transporter subunit EIIC [Paenibacillus polymyxa]OBA07997.1 hypothetical protein A9P44_01220 [Paenibacillus polymyxa]
MDRELPSNEINSQVKGENPISRLFDFISGVFTPLLPLLIGGSVFYFLPVMIAINAARKLGSNIFIAAAIGACPYSPGIIELLQSSLKMNSDGLPVVEQQYLASFILILIGVWLASKIEKGLKRFDRYSIQLLVVPTLTLIVIVPLLLFVFGPLWTTLAHNLSDGFASLFDDAEVLAGML